tara:strand:+ start:2531 stop:2938 length:408 start_codon:yes stop_codon:yes gene_type:complete
MIGDISRNLVEQFSDNFGQGNTINYAKGGVDYTDRSSGGPQLNGIVTAGEKLSKSYGPAKLLSVNNSDGDFSSEGKMFVAYSDVITTYVDRGDEKTSSLYYQRFFFPGRTTLPIQENNSMSVTKDRSNTRLSLRK